MDLHRGLIRLRRAEHIGLAHRNRGVARDQHLHQTTDGLQPQGERCDVVQQQIPQFPGEDAGLNGGADGHHFIGVHRLAGIKRHQGAHQLLNHGHAGGASHKHHIIDVIRSPAGVAQRGLDGHQQTIEQVWAKTFKRAAIKIGLHVQRAVLTRCDERKRDRCCENAGQFLLGLFSRFGQALKGLAVSPQIHPMLSLKGISDPVHDPLIKIIAAQLCIPIGGLDVEHSVRNPEQRHIECATTKIKHKNATNGTAIEAIGQGGSSGFIENALNGDAGQTTGVAGGLALGVVEISRNRDDCRLDGLAQVGAGIVHKLANDAGHQLLWRILPFRHGTRHAHLTSVIGTDRVRHGKAAVLQFLPVASHETLEVGEGVARAQHQLTSRQLSHQQFLVFAVTNHRWGGPATLGVGNHVRAACLQNGNNRVRGPQIDPDDPPHASKTCHSTLTASTSPHAQINVQQRNVVKPFLVT